MTAEDRLTSFVEGVRDSVDTDRGNILGMAVNQVSEVLAYLRITARDYEIANEEFMTYVDWRRQQFTEGTRELTQDEIRRLDEGRETSLTLHLRIETFYIFAKIVLDKIGPLFEALFGQGRAASLERHSKLVRNLDEYVSQHGLTPVPPDLSNKMEGLGERVAEYRDKWITHDASPRTMKGTMFELEKREATIAPGRLYPRKGEVAEPQPLSPRTLLPEIDAYVIAVVDYLDENVSAVR